MAAQAEIKAVITADDRASATLSKFGGHLGGIGAAAKVAAVGIAAAGAAAVAFGVSSLNAFQESEDAAAQLGAVLKSTGGAAGVSADMANDLAKSLQNVTRFSDEAILGGENMLLTFTNIGKDIFPQATETILNMSQALGQDLKGSAIQLGKALNDPIQGVTALRRVGVQFNDAQEKMIKKLVESGDLMGAQKMILKELETEFGGSARAAGQTFGGQLDILKNKFNDLQEIVGQTLATAIQPFVKTISDFVDANGQAIADWFLNLYNNVGKLANVFAVELAPTIIGFATYLWQTFKPVLDAVANAFMLYIMPALQATWAQIKNELLPALKEFWEVAGPVLTPVLKFLAMALGGIVVGALLAVVGAIRMVILIITTVLNNFNQFRVSFAAFVGGVQDGWRALVYFIGSTVGAVYNSITRPFIDAFNYVKNINWGEAFGNIARIGGNAIVGLIEGALNSALGGIPGVPRINLPRFANGVENFAGGMAIVGERGPEIVNLPRGSSVYPNGTSVSQASNINISISGAFMGTPDEARSFARKIVDGMQDIANAKNTTVAEMLS